MDDFERIAPDTLRIERVLQAPIDTVWRWLVDPELRRLWFAAGSAPEAGGDIALRFDHDELSADPVPYPPQYAHMKGVTVRERVVRIEPPRLLAITWVGGRQGTATFELSAAGAQTRLVLTHSGIGGPAEYGLFGSGWLTHLAVLQARIAGGAIRDFWALFRQSEATMRGEPGPASHPGDVCERR
jgi:uncharacterized protein YndB with AHSA1/START domain